LFLTFLSLTLVYLLLERKKLSAFRFERNPLFWVGVFLLPFLARIPFLLNHQAFLDSDRSVTLLMVKNIWQGVSYPIHFYGQAYQGSLNAYLYSILCGVLPSLGLSVLVVNLIFFCMFVYIASRLTCKINSSEDPFYPIVLLSIPITPLLFFSNEHIRGFPLVVFFEVALVYLVFELVFERRECVFLIGTVSGLLFWIYQPAVTLIAATFPWAAAGLVLHRRARLLGPILKCALGFLLGALPHILAELNNSFAGTRQVFLSTDNSGGAWDLDIASMRDVAAATTTRLDTNPAISFVLVTLFLVSLFLSLRDAAKERNLKKLYLPTLFANSLFLVLISGYPPVPRFIAHYRLLSVFTVLIALFVFSVSNHLAGRL
jgi:hypothetical protein